MIKHMYVHALVHYAMYTNINYTRIMYIQGI